MQAFIDNSGKAQGEKEVLDQFLKNVANSITCMAYCDSKYLANRHPETKMHWVKIENNKFVRYTS